MGALSVFLKDCREHGLALFSLAAGLIVVVLLLLARQRGGEFSLSSFEVVRLALISVLPLIAFIIGNRLIVREYTGGTRLFVESLPLHVATPLIVKFLFGWCYLLLLGVVLIALAALLAGAAEFIDARYLQLLLLKTSAIITLYWSLVFFASLTGKLRLLIYLIIGLALITLINRPDFDHSRLGPVALMDHQLFVFERFIIPWPVLIETAAIALALVVSGFVLALINEGSVIEQLGKPLSRRNFAAIALLGIAVFSIYAELQEKWRNTAYEFSGEQVLLSDSPPIEVSYLDEKYRADAEIIKTNLVQILSRFQADSGLATLPKLQIALNEELDRTEVYPEYSAGVLVSANFENYTYYEHSLLNTVGMHHLLLLLSNSRWDFESRHWLLDGVARWWAEGAAAAPESPNNPEHFAKAILAQRSLDPDIHPLLPWQTLTDQLGFEAAGALAYTALLYLAELQGPDAVIKLAVDYINEKPSSSSLESLRHLLSGDDDRFGEITGLAFKPFVEDWRRWLTEQARQPAVDTLLASVPAINGEVQAVVDAQGIYWLEASYSALPDYVDGVAGLCVLRHQPASAFDLETEIYSKERDRQPCVVGNTAHRVETRYSAGDRAYAVLEFENDQFTRPVILWAGRVHLQ